jgi:hypothetical protein
VSLILFSRKGVRSVIRAAGAAAIRDESPVFKINVLNTDATLVKKKINTFLTLINYLPAKAAPIQPSKLKICEGCG